MKIFKNYLSTEKRHFISAMESSASVIVSFLSKSKMDTTALPAMPKNENNFDSYMLQIYELKLTSILVELKDLFDVDHSRHLDLRQVNKDIVESYTSLITDVWHTELLQKSVVDRLDTLKPKDIVTDVREVINNLVDCCVILSL